MSHDHNSTSFKKLLDKLQTESWQLELLISGFAIFGLFQVIDPLQEELIKATGNDEWLYRYFINTMSPTLNILLITLLIHVILRGVWIGALGLRYVSNDIDYESLNYTEKFTKYLSNKVGSFDRYISRLENICSTLFAIAFLMAFYFMAYMLVLGFFILIANLVEATGLFNKDQLLQFNVWWGLLYFSVAFIVFIDFIGMGVLKKGKLRTKIYYPIYRFFSIVTLSFLYRPLVYNFLDQKRAKWLATFILPSYIVCSLLFSSFSNKHSNYLTEKSDSSAVFANTKNYEDVLNESKELADFAVIPSKVITTSYLPLKILYTPFKEDAVFEKDSTLVPKDDERGYGFHGNNISMPGLSLTFNEEKELDEQKKYLNVIEQLYTIYIDTLAMEKEFIYTTNNYNRMQFETYLDISKLYKGKHLLTIVGPRTDNTLFDEKIKTDTLVTIPFWYFKE